MTFETPHFFDKILANHRAERSMVDQVITEFGIWFKTSGVRFFRDYTDHGMDHVCDVLKTCEALMPESSKALITGGDVTTLCLAAVLHDSALHLSEDGFYQLIKGSSKNNRIHDFDKKNWEELWDEFLFEARRWDDPKIRNIFGTEVLDAGYQAVDPFDRWPDLRETDYKLVGEFIRKHHPRLAHEFAVYGIPSSSSNPLALPSALTKEQKDIIGTVARSHGLPLRLSVDYISEKYHKREYQGIHAAYLMTLLRLADYLQIDASRAPNLVFRYRVIPSHSSKLEWKTHEAVLNITAEAEDPESVEIKVLPQNIEVFLRLKEWLEGIQFEMDASWAVLGEIYGSSTNLKPLGLVWRRIRSNIDAERLKPEDFPFLPKRVRIETARAELLTLLVAPLYGDDPAFGIRELIQNSVDAVNEMEHQVMNDLVPELGQKSWKGNISVNLITEETTKGNSPSIVIEDNGVGMTEETLVNYFLKAGASFRNSDSWRRSFERHQTSGDGNEPKAKISRSGRFGVGALAAFLLGDSIDVSTRHYSSHEGCEFRARLSDDAIEVKRSTKLPVGTKITIPISSEVASRLLEDLNRKHTLVAKPSNIKWYFLHKPTVSYFIDGNKVSFETRSTDLSRWRQVPQINSLVVHWTHDRDFPSLLCNGIFVSNSKKLPLIENHQVKDGKFSVTTPAIHVTDNDGIFPLSLRRSEIITNEYGFESALAQSIIDDFFASLIFRMPESMKSTITSGYVESPFTYSGFRGLGYRKILPGLVLTKNGFCLPFEGVCETFSSSAKKFIWAENLRDLNYFGELDECDVAIAEEGGKLDNVRPNLIDLYKNGKISEFKTAQKSQIYELNSDDPDIEGTIFTSIDPSNSDLTQYWRISKVKNNYQESVKLGKQILMRGTTSLFSAEPCAIHHRRDYLEYTAEFSAASKLSFPFRSCFAGRRWTEIFGMNLIPWKMEDRLEKLEGPIKKLSSYTRFYC